MNSTDKKPTVKLREVTVLSNTEIAEKVFVLKFRRDFNFRAGQVLGLALASNEDPRLYSIASGETEEQISILYNIKPGGKLTPSLAQLKAGDPLWITEPFGTYTGEEGPAWWIAAGTGIAPFMSMLRSGLGEGKAMIHGSRTMDGFFFSEELLDFFGDQYIRCCSTGNHGDPSVYPGRVTQYLQQCGNLTNDRKYYLCGSAEMVVECRDILLSKGISFSNIVAEIYF